MASDVVRRAYWRVYDDTAFFSVYSCRARRGAVWVAPTDAGIIVAYYRAVRSERAIPRVTAPQSRLYTPQIINNRILIENLWKGEKFFGQNT